MFVLAAHVNRNGAICREYYQPEELGDVHGVVFGMDAKRRAKHYKSEEAAVSDIPAFKRLPGCADISPEVQPV
jgi:hypothetical protein